MTAERLERRALAALLLAAATAGCASFPGERLPAAGEIQSRARFANKPAVHFTLRFLADGPGGRPEPIEEPLPSLRMVVDRVATQSALFRSHTFEASATGAADYVIELELRNPDHVGAAALAGFVTGVTLFVVPTFVTDRYTLTAKVFERGGRLLKAYTYDDEIRIWFGLWFLPVAGRTPLEAATETWENMLRAFLGDLTRDAVLQYSLRPRPPGRHSMIRP